MTEGRRCGGIGAGRLPKSGCADEVGRCPTHTFRVPSAVAAGLLPPPGSEAGNRFSPLSSVALHADPFRPPARPFSLGSTFRRPCVPSALSGVHAEAVEEPPLPRRREALGRGPCGGPTAGLSSVGRRGRQRHSHPPESAGGPGEGASHACTADARPGGEGAIRARPGHESRLSANTDRYSHG